MHKCSCGRNILVLDNKYCGQCLFNKWVELNPKYCEWCGEFISPSSSDRYATYSKSRFHRTCRKVWKQDNKVVKEVELPLCKCGCGRRVKLAGRQFYSPQCNSKWQRDNGNKLWGRKKICLD